MRKAVGLLLVGLIFMTGSTLRLFAAGPGAVTYQGTLLDSGGAPPPNGVYGMTFTIYDAATDGTVRFTTNTVLVSVTMGFFSIDLEGASGVFQNFNQLYLEVAADLDSPPDGIQADETYFPRQRLTAAPYSESASQADNALLLGGVSPSSFLQNGASSLSTSGPTTNPNTLLTGLAANANFGVLQLFGTAGVRLNAFVDTDNTGGVATFGTAGQFTSFMGAAIGGPNRGAIEVYDTAGNARADMFVDANLAGASRTFGPNGNLNTFIGSNPDNDNLGSFEVYDTAGNLRSEMFADTTGAGVLRTYGLNGNPKVLVTTVTGSPNFGAIAVLNSTGAERASITVSPADGSGSVAVRGPSGSVYSALFSNGTAGGSVEVNDNAGNNKAILQTTSDFSGGLTLNGPANLPNVVVSSVSTTPNRGAVAVYSGGGVPKALMYVNANNFGTVSADVITANVKNFVVDHPNKQGTKIVYTCLEGPEAAMYCRGTIKLANGRASIELPEHFVALANSKTITVQLTPGSFDSKGVAVGAIDNGVVQIGELMGGTGNYEVHYLVHAVRAGLEDKPVEVSAAEFDTRLSLTPPVDRASDAPMAELGKPTRNTRAIQPSRR